MSTTTASVLSAPSVVIAPTGKHDCTVIWLHGLGDNGLGWQFLVEELSPQLPTVKWILPTAPLRSVAYSDNAVVPGWFNVVAGGSAGQVDEEGMLSSVQLVDEIIQSEVNQGTKKIILGGFSQGCTITLLTSRITKTKLAGIIGVAGWLPRGKLIDKAITDTNRHTPVMICHGDMDDVVLCKYGQSSARYLVKTGYSVDLKVYSELGHTSCDQQMKDIGIFIQRQQLVEVSNRFGPKL
ncbi:Phospholipase/carboxylesterase/thioesterase [Chlamydoabsidia padenii]|nr:Phospholipase/carboxylesterase/thioesterase [Chlamydoabsidia padenii]